MTQAYKENYHDKDTQLDLTDEQIKVRNKIVEKYIPLAKSVAHSYSYDEFAGMAPIDGGTDLDAHEILGACLEALVIYCGKHVRNCGQKGIDPATNHPTASYLRTGIEGAAVNSIQRDHSIVKGASVGDIASVDETVEDEEGEIMPKYQISYGDTPWHQEQEQDEADYQHEQQVRAAIEEHLPTIRQCMEQLTMKQRYVITATQNGRTQEFMAGKLGVTQQAVELLQKRAFVALRQQLEEKGLNSDSFFL